MCLGIAYDRFEIDDCNGSKGALREIGKRDSRTGWAAQRRAVLAEALRLRQQLWPPGAASYRQLELLHRSADCGNGLCARSSSGVFGDEPALQDRGVESIRSSNSDGAS